MNELTIPSISSMLRVEPSIEAINHGGLPMVIEPSREAHRIRRVLPQSVGKHLESKVLVCETHNKEIAILVTESFASSPQVAQVKIAMGRRHPGMRVEVHPVTPLELLSYSKSNGELLGAERQASSSYGRALEDIVKFAVDNDASDITLDINYDQPMSPISYKIAGRQIRLDDWRMATPRLEEIVNIAWQEVAGGAHSSFDKDVESQGIYTLPVDQRQFKLRFQSIITDTGPSISLRLLEQGVVKKLDAYGYLDTHLNLLKRYKNSRNGLIGISGKVDSGKTTGISAVIDTLPEHYKVFMLEDPVEILLAGVYQITVARPVDGSGDANYAMKLMALKRVAPDAVSIGEIRDHLNAKAITDVGGMGTLGFFTLHASCMLHIPQKLWSESIGVPRDFLSSPGMFKLLAHQALVPRLCSCAKPIHSLTQEGGLDNEGDFQDGVYWHHYIQKIEAAFKIDASSMKVRNHLGCEKCHNPYFTDLNGYAGRQPIAEMIEPNKHYELLRLIGQGDTLGMYEYFDTLPREKLDHEDMTNKTIVECGLYRALQGKLDPRDIEQATEPFENLILQPRYR
jgi:type II secretory ATPase GspE/PulE/Tfp pilus assembly ATPase PilB-like protein